MSALLNLSLLALTFLGFGLGGLVMLRNPQSRLHRLFLLMSFANASWILSNALFGLVTNDQLAYVIALVSYTFAAAMSLAFLYFVAEVSSYTIGRIWAILGGLFAVVSSVPGFLATGVINKNIVTTPFVLVYASVIALSFSIGILLLLMGMRKQRGQRRQQVAAMFIGMVGSGVGGIVFNLVLPLQGNYQFVQLGPAFSLLFVVLAAYAIVRHRLFDLRAAILRVVAYSFAVLTMAVLYVIGAYLMVTLLFGNALSIGVYVQLVYLSLAVLAALTFQPIKRFFDMATRAVFYKNAYNTQEVIDKLGNLLVREVDVARLARRSMQLLAGAIKPTNVQMVLTHDHTEQRDVALTQPFKQSQALIKTLRNHHTSFVVTDELAAQAGPVYQQLASNGVSIAAPLVTSNATIGYLLVGYKASGDAFTEQDIDLVHIFADELAVAVQNALRFEEISHFNVTLKEQVDEATGELRASNRKLHELDEAKDEFISMASHQLRTPLTSVKGYLSMVLEGDAGRITADQRKLLEEAYGSSQRMVYLIGDFLNVSRLQTGKFELELAPSNLGRLVGEEVDQLKATAARRGVQLTYHQPSGFPDLVIDEAKIRQVVMNFIDNAIFYSRTNGQVAIELTATAHDVTLAVHDNGIGVPQAERHHLFTKFFRASNARRVRPDGTGIGLYMAKKVVTAHGGSIIFESRENKGSTFGFKLPLKNQAQ